MSEMYTKRLKKERGEGTNAVFVACHHCGCETAEKEEESEELHCRVGFVVLGFVCVAERRNCKG